ncbi:protein phosphatase 2C domain-containing protein [Streptomyces sp. NPDC012637]|uniref:protein phosphatase 2C domain-containing protein n=1 Tax=Streptomyces sp. NPDC012637 TaxID=3364842 RepID=UPI0036F0BD9C
MQVRQASAARPHGANEDLVLSSPVATVILDGAGMAPGMDSGCSHGVAWYVQQLGARLHAEAAREESSLIHCLAAAIESTADLHRDTCTVDAPLSPSATVAMARVQGELFEWLVLGDCTVVVDQKGVVTAVTDDRLAHVAPQAREALAQATPGSEERGKAHQALVREERGLRNTQGGYWVAAADPAAASQALTGTASASHVQRAALLTDGAARLVTTFHTTDWPGYLDLLTSHGPDYAIRQVREAEQSDPHLSRWPRSKQHDDATIAYIRP